MPIRKDEDEREHNKLWLIINKLNVSEGQKNKFYLNGGEKIKLGRVMMKIMEVNMDSDMLDGDNNTEMSFREIDPPEMRATSSDNNGPFGQDDNQNVRPRSPSVTSQTDLRGEEYKDHVKGLGVGPLEEDLKE
jgi:hypothetical protein